MKTQIDADVIALLLGWFEKNKRSLPWRSEIRDPYKVWISEIMLQQTTVKAVIQYFERWMNVFPNVKSLASALESDVIQMWSGLGYYSRVRNIHKTAQIIVNDYGAEFPKTRKELLNLPGIGEYTAGAILSLAFAQNEAILDGNLIRFFSRFYALDFLPENRSQKEIYWNYAKLWANSGSAQKINEGLMEWGALHCTVKNPQCSQCCLGDICRAYAIDQVNFYPPLKKKKDWVDVDLVAFCIQKGDQIGLIRPKNQRFLNGLVGFPLVEKHLLKGSEWEQLIECEEQIKHTITHHHLQVRVVVSQDVPMKLFDDLLCWVPEEQLFQELGSSLAKKIWRLAKT